MKNIKAFPGIHIKQEGDPAYNAPSKYYFTGMSLRDYFIAHAPSEPTWFFEPKMKTERPKPTGFDKMGNALNSNELYDWDSEYEKQRYIQWPSIWADAMLAEREKRGAEA